MNKQDLLKQAIISYDISAIRGFKNDDEVDFSIDLEEAISIGLSKNAHLNYFKMFFNKEECQYYFANKNFHKELIIKNRFDILDFLASRVDISECLEFLVVDNFLKNSSHHSSFNRKDKKLFRSVITNCLYYSENKNNIDFYNFITNLYDKLLNDVNDIQRFILFFNNYCYFYKFKKNYINHNIDKILSIINTQKYSKETIKDLINILKNNLTIEYINEDLINKYSKNKIIFDFFHHHYNLLIRRKIIQIETKESFEKEIEFIVSKSELGGKFYTVTFSYILGFICQYESKYALDFILNYSKAKISTEKFSNIIKSIEDKDFLNYILNKNIVCNQSLKEHFIETSEEGSWNPLIFTKESIFIYSFLNDKNEFTFTENFSILRALTQKSQEHELFNFIFNRIVEELNEKQIIELLNLSSSYFYDENFNFTYPALYFKFMLFNNKVIYKIKNKKYYSSIKFPNETFKRDFLNTIKVYSF